VTLYDELKRLFDKKNLDEITQEEMKNNIGALQEIYDKVTEVNRKNDLLKAKFENDTKYARVQKRVMENAGSSVQKNIIFETLSDIKQEADEKILNNTQLLNNESYFTNLMIRMVMTSFEKRNIDIDEKTVEYINTCLVKEYLTEHQGTQRW
jgi:type I restriction enzyme R subunit